MLPLRVKKKKPKHLKSFRVYLFFFSFCTLFLLPGLKQHSPYSWMAIFPSLVTTSKFETNIIRILLSLSLPVHIFEVGEVQMDTAKSQLPFQIQTYCNKKFLFFSLYRQFSAYILTSKNFADHLGWLLCKLKEHIQLIHQCHNIAAFLFVSEYWHEIAFVFNIIMNINTRLSSNCAISVRTSESILVRKEKSLQPNISQTLYLYIQIDK